MITVLTQNGAPYRLFADYDQASDECMRLKKTFPWFEWAVICMSVDQTKSRFRSTTER